MTNRKSYSPQNEARVHTVRMCVIY